MTPSLTSLNPSSPAPTQDAPSRRANQIPFAVFLGGAANGLAVGSDALAAPAAITPPAESPKQDAPDPKPDPCADAEPDSDSDESPKGAATAGPSADTITDPGPQPASD